MLTRHRVLVVDGAEDSRKLAIVALESAGFAVIEAATGADALDLARTARPAAIVLDVSLPDIDGFEVCQRLKTAPPTRAIPVLFLAATSTQVRARTQGFESGGEAFLTTPYEPAELVSVVTSLVRLRQAEDALRTRDSLLAIARAVGGGVDMTEALRLVCRELARLTGADMTGAYLLDRERHELRPVAGYRIPKHLVGELASTPVPRQPFWPAVVRAGQVVASDDVPNDERFAFELFRRIPHQSGILIPLVVDAEVAGIFYLTWRTERHRVEPDEAATLKTIGQQVGLLLRNARLVEEAEIRRRVAEAAREHNQLLFERNLAGVFRATVDGRLLECNEALTRLLGHRGRDETLRHNAWAFWAEPDEAERLRERLGRERRVGNYETRWRRADGADVSVMMNVTRIGLGDDAHVAGIVLDISERKRAEEALRDRERQLRNLGDNLPDSIIYQVVRRADGSNYFVYMSSGLERAFGVRVDDVMRDATLVYRLVRPEDLERIRIAGDESIRTGEPMEVEYRVRIPDGPERWFHLRGRPRPLPDGATLWDVIAIDITERKNAEETLRLRQAELRTLTEHLRVSEERYRVLFERSFVGIFRTRPDGIVVECNDAFARILGHKAAADMRGRDVREHYVTPADRDLTVARLAAGEDVVDVEVDVRRLDGIVVPVSVSARRLLEPEGPIHEGIVVDLTDRKRAEEALALRSVAELANAAAHEINNPLAVLLGHLDLMELGRTTGDRIEGVRAAALRIRDIVKHMTQITHLERSTGWSPTLPSMLDLRRSGGDDVAPS
jgi:PAS domain S-box-containing protein